jgi:hypothetical protein
MKRSLLLVTILLGVAIGAGCATIRRVSTPAKPPLRTYALAVTVDGVFQPTPAQFATVQSNAVAKFGPLGYTLVTDLTLAERILRIDYRPNPYDPEAGGRAIVLGWRSNPLFATANTAYTSTSRYPTSFGFGGSFSSASYQPWNGLGYGYYGYGDSYYDGYSYSSPTLNPVAPPVTKTTPSHPPLRHDPTYCPPNSNRIPALPGQFAPVFVSHVPSNQPPSYSDRPRRGYGDSGSSGTAQSSSTGTASGAGGVVAWRADRSASFSDRATAIANWRAEHNNGSSTSTASNSSSGTSSGGWRSWFTSRDDGHRSSGDRSYSRSDSGSSGSYSRSDSGSSSYSSSSGSSSSYSSGSSSSYSSGSSSSSSSYSSSSDSSSSSSAASSGSGTNSRTLER